MHHGEYLYTNSEKYIGNFHNGKKGGQGELIFPTGLKISGNFTNGNLDLHACIKFEDGNVFEGEVIDNEIGSKGQMYYENGDFYDGYFKEGERHGFGSLLSKDGTKFVGRWEGDTKTGYGKEYNPNTNEYYQGEYDSNLRDGKGRLIDNDLQVFDAEFRRGDLFRPKKSSKYIKRKAYEKIIYHFMKKQDNKQPHLIIID